LKTDTGYCCLGVLEHCLTGEVEMDDNGGSRGLPSTEWLAKQGILFARVSGDFDELETCDDEGIPAKWTSPYLPALKTTAHSANDNGVTFKEIAVAIRLCSEGV
jgi:hypothetical protein